MSRGSVVVGTVALVLAGFVIAPVSAAPKQHPRTPEVKLALDQVPPAVKATLQREAPGATIETVDREGDGAQAVYEADAVIDGKNWEIEVAPDGKLIGKKLDLEEAKPASETEEPEGREVKLPFDQVPPAVKATLLKEAQGASIKTVDREGDGAKAVYEADVLINGKNWEIKVAPDGKLIGKKLDQEAAPGASATKKPTKKH